MSTRPLVPSLIESAGQHAVEIDTLSFIETMINTDFAVKQEIELAARQKATVVFTSMNSVEAVTKELGERIPSWNIYCIGNTTRALVEDHFGAAAIAGTAINAAELALLIIENKVAEVIFFCGDKRREELPDLLNNRGIRVHELVVYRTFAVHHSIVKQYEGILFFSPSAAESFFSTNNLPAETVLFAIGSTTANELRKYTTNTIITGKEPGKENLVNEAVKYFVKSE